MKPLAPLLLALLITAPAQAELGKGRRLLIQHGLQVQGLINKDDAFDLKTYKRANYSSLLWMWAISPEGMGRPPGELWSRWVGEPSQMPLKPEERPYAKRLLALQLGDEQDLNDPAVRERIVNWLTDARRKFPDTIIYVNNFGGQVRDAELSDMIQRGKPDMLAFDTYPWRSQYDQRNVPLPAHGSPTHWYAELRRYRDHARAAGVPFAIYRQTFAAVQDYDSTVYRHPSPSEMNLNTYAALAFGATWLIDFTYNTSASSLFDRNAQGQWAGDRHPNARYHHLSEINRAARYLGQALVRLKAIPELRRRQGAEPSSPAISDHPQFPSGYTSSVLFLRGRTGPGKSDVTPLPINFHPDPDAPETYSWWEFGKNDPYLNGWGRKNVGKVNHGRVGDVILSWLDPLASIDTTGSESAGAGAGDQVYLMVVNGLTAPTGTAADAAQEITLDFARTGADGTSFPGVLRLDAKTGKVGALKLAEPGPRKLRLTLRLDGGEGALLKFGSDPKSFIHLRPLARDAGND
ncbi:MAG TPA: hypothetical protein VGR35_06150 [Tepidisphaeraceae bacterium]|nr:hypothetical protein [Tepidisphaeraceae bacterium]